MRKVLYTALIAICLVITLLCVWVLCRHFRESKEEADMYEDLANLVNQEETEPHITTENTAAELIESQKPDISPEYADIYKRNSDMVGWIFIADTRINYPVMQSPNDPNFYLKHNFDKHSSNHGCPYVNANCDVTKPSDNLIIYGHHMKDGSMFADLDKFTSQSFWETHKTITFNTLTQWQTYEVVAVFKVATGTGAASEFKYYAFTDANTPEEFNTYISSVKSNALYDTGITAAYGDKLLTLSTCEYSNYNGRLVIVAKRIDP